jgi:uncharacterized membrane protein
MRLAAIYLAIAVPLWIADGLWLGIAAKNFYRRALGHLMADRLRVLPAALFYLFHPVGLGLFAFDATANATWNGLRGALFGLFCYGTYDLVNQATLKGWPWRLTLVDMAWGTFVSGCSVAIARLILSN